MGEVAYSRAKNDEAKQAFSSAKVILDKLYVEQPKNMELLKNLGANAFWLGQLKYDESDFDGAQPLFELYRDYSERMNQLEPNNFDALIELSYSNNTIGSLYLKQNNYLAAKVSFEVSFELKNKALSIQPKNIMVKAELVDTLSWLAKTEQNLGNLHTSLRLQEKVQDQLESALTSDFRNANLIELLAISYSIQASILDFQNELPTASAKNNQAAEMFEKLLMQDSENDKWKSHLAKVSIFQKLLSQKQQTTLHRPDSAEINKLSKIAINFSDKYPIILIHTVRYYQIIGAWQNSEYLIKHAIQSASSSNKNVSQDEIHILALAELDLAQARQFSHYGNLKAKFDKCSQAISIIKPLVSLSNNVKYLNTFVQAHSCLNMLNKIPKEIKFLHEMGVQNNNFNHN
jgi:tetratricopeptide (TPR) repeat protein